MSKSKYLRLLKKEISFLEELIKSELSLVQSYKEYFDSFFEILTHMGKMNPNFLNLSVETFNDTQNFDKIKYKWLDILE